MNTHHDILQASCDAYLTFFCNGRKWSQNLCIPTPPHIYILFVFEGGLFANEEKHNKKGKNQEIKY